MIRDLTKALRVFTAAVQTRSKRVVTAMEFPSEKALKEYMREHPGADPSVHYVAKQRGNPKRYNDLKEHAKGQLSKAFDNLGKNTCSGSELRSELKKKMPDASDEDLRVILMKLVDDPKVPLVRSDYGYLWHGK